jgi:putative ABC transport system substrate-binding protein
VVARAQQKTVPVIGYLDSRSAERTGRAAYLRRSLAETGYVEGKNVSIEYRWADDDNGLLPALAEDLVRRNVTLMVTSGGTLAALAAKRATPNVPIVFIVGTNPVERGLVARLAHPGANLTGVTFLSDELGAKRLDLLHELKPQAATIAYLKGVPPAAQQELRDTLGAAKSLDRQIVVSGALNDEDLEAAFAMFAQRGAVAQLSPWPRDTNFRLSTLHFRLLKQVA